MHITLLYYIKQRYIRCAYISTNSKIYDILHRESLFIRVIMVGESINQDCIHSTWSALGRAWCRTWQSLHFAMFDGKFQVNHAQYGVFGSAFGTVAVNLLVPWWDIESETSFIELNVCSTVSKRNPKAHAKFEVKKGLIFTKNNLSRDVICISPKAIHKGKCRGSIKNKAIFFFHWPPSFSIFSHCLQFQKTQKQEKSRITT